MARSGRPSIPSSAMGSPPSHSPDLDVLVSAGASASPSVSLTDSPAYNRRGSTQLGPAPSELGEGREEVEGKGKKKKERKEVNGVLKPSQRPSWSCTECTRRKIKCDKIVPGCNQCARRGKAHECRLDDSQLALSYPSNPSTSDGPRMASSTEYDALCTSLSHLRQQLFNLENVVNSFAPHPTATGPDGKPMYSYPAGIAPRRESAYHLLPTGAGPSGGGGGGPSIALETNEAEGEKDPRMLRLEVVERGGGIEYSPLPNQIERLREQGQIAESDGEVEAAVTLEFLALGRDRKADHFSRATVARPAEDSDESLERSQELVASTHSVEPHSWASEAAHNPTTASAIDTVPSQQSNPGPSSATVTHGGPPELIDLLPNRATSDAIVQWSLDRVGWQHGPAVHPATFEQETRQFFTWGDRRGKLVNQAWLALYFAVLTVGVKHMTVDDALACGINPGDLTRLPRMYFDASVEALHRSNFLARHSIFSVQTIVILVVACQDVGGSDLLATLLACGIKVAQSLAIHRFTSDAEWEQKQRTKGIDPSSETGIKQLIDREIRKRLWCVLSTEDWVSNIAHRSYAISSNHSTPLPINCYDDDLSIGRYNPLPIDTPTPVSKILLSHQIAACIRRFFEDVNSGTAGTSPSYDRALLVDGQIRDILRSAPKYLREVDADISHLPPYVAWFRHYWHISTAHKLLVVHRVFFSRDRRYAYSRKAAIEAARSIIAQLRRGGDLGYQQIWTVPYHAIVASTTLVLDCFQTSTSDKDTIEKRGEVQAALTELGLLAQTGSSIAARGVQLLTTLLQEEAKHRRPAGQTPAYSAQTPASLLGTSTSSKRPAAEGPEGEPKFGQAAKRVALTSTSRLSTSPQLTATSPRSVTGNPLSAPYYAPLASTGYTPKTSASSPQLSDGQLTQDAFDSILFSVGAYAGPTASNEDGMIDPALDAGVEFWRALDQTFEPGSILTGATGGHFGTGEGVGDMLGGFGVEGGAEWDGIGLQGGEAEMGLMELSGATNEGRWG